jgi:hypothetical protein
VGRWTYGDRPVGQRRTCTSASGQESSDRELPSAKRRAHSSILFRHCGLPFGPRNISGPLEELAGPLAGLEVGDGIADFCRSVLADVTSRSQAARQRRRPSLFPSRSSILAHAAEVGTRGAYRGTQTADAFPNEAAGRRPLRPGLGIGSRVHDSGSGGRTPVESGTRLKRSVYMLRDLLRREPRSPDA